MKVFPEECFLSGSSIREKQRTFSIKPGRGEAAVGVTLHPLREQWPQGKGICDGLFVCLVQGKDELVVALVELKGSDVAKAITQVQDTCELLCNLRQPLPMPNVPNVHDATVIDANSALNKNGHGSGTLGIIVAKIGLALGQKEKGILWKKYRLRLWIVTDKLRAITCRELARKFVPTG